MTPFPDEPRLDAPLGSRYRLVVVEDLDRTYGAKAGDILTLDRNDGTKCPRFNGGSRGENWYVNWYQLAPLRNEER
jgi:hypothetical protein